MVVGFMIKSKYSKLIVVWLPIQCSWVTCKVAGGMDITHTQWVVKITRLWVEKTWSLFTWSRYMSKKSNLHGSIFQSTKCASSGFWPSLIELSNFGRIWAGLVVVCRREGNIDSHNCSTFWSWRSVLFFFLALQVHHCVLSLGRWGTMNSTHSIWKIIKIVL